MKLKVGDYVEVLEGGEVANVEVGEQGVITDDDGGQGSLSILFPARSDHWGRDERKFYGNFGWLAQACNLRLLYRPIFKR